MRSQHVPTITMAEPAASPFGGSHFLLGFLPLQRRAGTAGGRGKGRKPTPSTPGIAAVIANGPESPFQAAVRDCASLECLSRGVSLAPSLPTAQASESPRPPAGVGQQGRGDEEEPAATPQGSFRGGPGARPGTVGAGTSRLPTLSFSGPSALAKRRAPLCATAEHGHSAQLEPCNSVPLNPRRGGRAVAARSREDRGSLRVSPRPPTSNTPAAVLPWCTGFPVHSGKGGQLQREGRGKGYSHSTPRGSFPEAAWFLLRTSTRKDTRWGC